MTVSLAMMFGRTGSLIGNIIFPYLLSLGCLPPFLMLALILIGKYMRDLFCVFCIHKPNILFIIFLFFCNSLQPVVSCVHFYRKQQINHLNDIYLIYIFKM